MPKFLEKALQKEYGKDSDIPYKIMNARGFMRGNRITAKGRAAEAKHKTHADDKTTPHGAREVEAETHEEHKDNAKADRTKHKKVGATVAASAGRIDEKLKGFMIDKMRGFQKGKK